MSNNFQAQSAPQAASRSTPRRRKATPVPSLHLVMIRIAVAGVIAGGFGYFFAPPEKSAFFERLAEWSMVFLFGKFTNGFGKRGEILSGDNDDEDGGDQ